MFTLEGTRVRSVELDLHLEISTPLGHKLNVAFPQSYIGITKQLTERRTYISNELLDGNMYEFPLNIQSTHYNHSQPKANKKTGCPPSFVRQSRYKVRFVFQLDSTCNCNLLRFSRALQFVRGQYWNSTIVPVLNFTAV